MLRECDRSFQAAGDAYADAVASYAIGEMIRSYDTCELDDLRAQTNGTITSLFKSVATARFLRARTGGTK